MGSCHYFYHMFAAHQLRYHDTTYFSKIVLDYIDGVETLRPFYSFTPDLSGIKEAIEHKQQQQVDRQVLVTVLKDQYKMVTQVDAVSKNTDALLNENTFTICTAHQPNLFTGPLYFIYKILHAIKLADRLSAEFPGYKFVPVYYMGSEDADLAELNHFNVAGKKYEWRTKQSGAVGRMLVDKELVGLLDELKGQIGNTNEGLELVDKFRDCFEPGSTIQQATFKLVHNLFGKYGLVVLIPDDARLKKQMIPVCEDDLFNNGPSKIVAQASASLDELYKAQAHARPINLFYLKDNIRERIERNKSKFDVVNTSISFTEEELKKELNEHPERFSPNVILRGLFQETILPNIAFIGGGGEIAYWLQLKELFEHNKIVFPVLVLRNSFLIIAKQLKALIDKHHLSFKQLFQPELNILNEIIESENKAPKLNGEVDQLSLVYEALKESVNKVDSSLLMHVEALKARSLKGLIEVEKKMFRAERKKLSATHSQVKKLKEKLFPNNNLQEREENISSYYAQWGCNFIDYLLKNSLSLEQQFVILTEQPGV